MKNIIFTAVFSLLAFVANTQDITKDTTYWLKGGETALNISQVSLSNWAAGGENSLSMNSFINLFANYKKENTIWDNRLELAYGILKQGEQNLRKSDDKLYFSSTYGKSAFKKWYYSASFGFKTQFSEGYNYPDETTLISNILAPAYVSIAVGLDYKPNESFSLSVSPISGKITIVANDSMSASGAFGVDPGKKIRFEFGGTLKVHFKKEIVKNVSLESNLELFSNYLENPENIDVDWQVFISLKVNEFISANIGTHLIYDKDIMIADKEGNMAARTQFKEMFGLGITYKF